MLKRCWIFGVLLYTAFMMVSCASSPKVNLQTARIKHKWNGTAMYQLRHIESHDALHSAPFSNGIPWYGVTYNTTSNAGFVRVGYGWERGRTGWETGIQMGFDHYFEWEFPLENNSINYFTMTAVDMSSLYCFPYVKFGFNQQKRLKFAVTGELTGGSFIASYDYKRITPYASIKLAFTPLENPTYEWYDCGPDYRYYGLHDNKTKVSLVPLLGCEFRFSRSIQITTEGGVVPHYFRNNNLYILGIGLTFNFSD